ncbi:MAG: nucleotidyltransferase domain-containing protein [Nanoarchaeota archaeon]
MKEVIAYVYDFLSIVFEDEIEEKIKEIILFGSVAKKSYDKKSDIDLFFNVKETKEIKEIEEKLKKILKSFEIKAEKTWALKKIKFPINFIVGSLENETWKNLKEEIVSSGILLYGEYKEMPENLSHNYLFSYSLNNLSRKNKMKFIRKMFGYTLKKGRKKYEQSGFLKNINGLKIGTNSILIPSGEIINVKKLFNDFKIEYKIIESWIRM